MPMVGMVRREVISRASSASTSSRTTANTPACSTASASASNRSFLGLRTALDLVATLFLHVLREHTDVAHDGDAGIAHGANLRHDLNAAFQLDRLGARQGEEVGIGDRIGGGLVGVIRQIGHDKRTGFGTGNGGDMVPHLGERNLCRVGITEDDHADRIAHQNERHAGLVEQSRGRIIVGGQRRDFLAARLGRANPVGGDFLLLVHSNKLFTPHPKASNKTPSCIGG